ncbi:unnamed protein product [Albugo candida]|uniref:Uncharacterized protein n=1 Tax=Albugo candida TaxID=65357 RepID=A0A024GFF1_9STRA|nr:unnamed protein product [Albugo candida]|eukprot:CCI45476.1 unnamed protein product [Albugo candida]
MSLMLFSVFFLIHRHCSREVCVSYQSTLYCSCEYFQIQKLLSMLEPFYTENLMNFYKFS